jgi:PAP2 superfamily
VTRVRVWLVERHSLAVEALVVLVLYAAYEVSRGLVVGDTSVAIRHAQDVAALERSLHVFVERNVQDAARSVPGLVGTLGFAYLTMHLTVTAGFLVWVHRRRPKAFPFVRTTLVLATAFALIGFVVFPTAPPRLAGIGIIDTVSGRHVDLNRGLVSSVYNPLAAVPSLHAGYAALVGASLVHYGRHLLPRLIGLAYPAFVLLVIVATGNHFFFDAAAGGAVVVLAAAIAALLTRGPTAKPGTISRLDQPAPSYETSETLAA